MPAFPADPAQTVTLSPETLRLLVQEEVASQMAAFARPAPKPVPVPAELAGYVGIREMVLLMPPGMRSEATIRRLISAGMIPARKFRGRWCLRPADVAAALQKNGENRARIHEVITTWKERKPSSRDPRKTRFGSQKNHWKM